VQRMTKKIGLTALCLALVLSLIGAVDGGVASASDADSTGSTTVPPTTEAPAASEAPPTSEAAAPTTTAAPAPTTTAAPAPTTTAPPAAEAETPRRWGPDPRWINYGTCGRGITACHVAKAHQRDGLYQWRQGRWFRWGTDRVRGHRGETWGAFRLEARQIRAYVFALYVAQLRRVLVNRWSGVANCESGGNWAINTGNGYYGGLQFNLSTWRAYGGTGMPNERPAWYQASIADRIRVQSGLHHWPHCGAYYG
jgi:hypothetical protein